MLRNILPAAASESTSSSLLARARANNSEAWRELVGLYGPLVCHWCHRLSVPPDDVPDVLQEVMQAVSRALGGFQSRGSGSFRAWLATVTRNKVYDFRRARADRTAAVGGSDHQRLLAQMPFEPEAAFDEHDESAKACILRSALEVVRRGCQEQTWEAFWRTAIEGQSPAEAAAALGMTAANVRQAKSRLLRRLRDLLQDEFDPPG